MITALPSKAKENLIIEAASDLINTFVQEIAADPITPAEEGSWKQRYPYIADLNILTATKSGADDADHLEVTQEYPDRYPYTAFFLDAVRPNSESKENNFQASLGCRVEVKGETFAIAQREIHEIHNCIRSILLLDKSLGEHTGRGGVIDLLKFAYWSEPEFLVDVMKKHIIGINYFYYVWYRERTYR